MHRRLSNTARPHIRQTTTASHIQCIDVVMRDGLIRSLNVVTVELAMRTGLDRVANTAVRFGLPRPTSYPAMALGTTEVTPLQVAAAYAAFVNGGRIVKTNAGCRSE
jgi:membrane carboxypeptidase/penicillin-binding protein